jgi:hypothetical protein
MTNEPELTIIERDIIINRMQLELSNIENSISKNHHQLQEITVSNEFLDMVKNDYAKYDNHIRDMKISQETQMKFLIDYIEDTIQNSNLSDTAIQAAEQKQYDILKKLNSLKDNLDEVIDSGEDYLQKKC